jgi:nickel-dependent lactate racemase
MNSGANKLPRFFTVRQAFVSKRIEDVHRAVTERLEQSEAISIVQPGQTIAIGVGSRGIDRIDQVVKATVEYLKSRGAVPFVVPAMGSHGGANASGQRDLLREYGIAAETIGCPVEATMETVEIDRTDSGVPIRIDRIAAEADHLLPINRVKPHTRLTGTIQSGLCKMLMIGLGNHQGAERFHQAFRQFDYQLDRVADEIIGKLRNKLPILGGIALVEDAFDQLGEIAVVAANDLLRRDRELLELAEQWLPKLPFDSAELLIVDRIGKEISGTGMDTNVLGRKSNDKIAGPEEWPKIEEIYVRDLTEKTRGNAAGIGIAEYTHRRVVDVIDLKKTRVNCVTAGHASAGALPIWFDSDREVLEAVASQAYQPADEFKWMWIADTLHLQDVRCSEGYLAAASERDDLEIIAPLNSLCFDSAGNLTVDV